ncbi:MAG: hypothetical protein IPN22_05880 [Bacteroidetes bacterium]|nr:hypothetical protein [Bacteroidota bacterium]
MLFIVGFGNKVFHRKGALRGNHLTHDCGVFKLPVIVQLFQPVVVAHICLYVVVVKAVVVLHGGIVVALYPADVAPGLGIGAALYHKTIVVNLYGRSPAQLYIAVVHRLRLEVDHLYRQRCPMVAAMQPEFTELDAKVIILCAGQTRGIAIVAQRGGAQFIGFCLGKVKPYAHRLAHRGRIAW